MELILILLLLLLLLLLSLHNTESTKSKSSRFLQSFDVNITFGPYTNRITTCFETCLSKIHDY